MEIVFQDGSTYNLSFKMGSHLNIHLSGESELKTTKTFVFVHSFSFPSERGEINPERDKRGSNHALSPGNPKVTAVFIGSPSLPSKVPKG